MGLAGAEQVAADLVKLEPNERVWCYFRRRRLKQLTAAPKKLGASADASKGASTSL